MTRKNLNNTPEAIALREAIVKHLNERRPASLYMDQISTHFYAFPPATVKRAVWSLVRVGLVKCYCGMYYA